MATQEQWEVMKEWAEHMSPIGATLLELRAKVEALEAAQHTHSEEPDVTPAPAPADGLVERVARAIGDKPCEVPLQGNPWSPEARSAIREVAEWLEQQQEVPIGRSTASADYFAAMLREEANR
jgi:hypothetical protein